MAIRVVLADDHVLVRQSLKSLLEHEGFQVVGEASDGQEALRRIESLHPDIAVMDITMPILNGLEAARELSRRSPKTRATAPGVSAACFSNSSWAQTCGNAVWLSFDF